MAPSVKTLQRAFPKLSTDDIAKIREAMHLSEAGGFRYDINRLARRALDIADQILGTHGVESIPRGRNANSPAIDYCNTGDTYGATILYVNGSFRVGSWGDIVERGNYD